MELVDSLYEVISSPEMFVSKYPLIDGMIDKLNEATKAMVKNARSAVRVAILQQVPWSKLQSDLTKAITAGEYGNSVDRIDGPPSMHIDVYDSDPVLVMNDARSDDTGKSFRKAQRLAINSLMDIKRQIENVQSVISNPAGNVDVTRLVNDLYNVHLSFVKECKQQRQIVQKEARICRGSRCVMIPIDRSQRTFITRAIDAIC